MGLRWGRAGRCGSLTWKARGSCRAQRVCNEGGRLRGATLWLCGVGQRSLRQSGAKYRVVVDGDNPTPAVMRGSGSVARDASPKSSWEDGAPSYLALPGLATPCLHVSEK